MTNEDPVVQLEYTSSHANKYVEASDDITISNISLEKVIYPLGRSDFLAKCFRQKAVHVTNNHGNTNRISDLIAGMYSLDIPSILRNTSSDNIFVWIGNTNMEEDSEAKTNNKDESTLQSIEIEDPETAYKLFKHGGHAIYCRAPPDVEQPLVASILAGTGLGCGQYDPTGVKATSLGRGEVETFIGTKGHFTNFHTDFQEVSCRCYMFLHLVDYFRSLSMSLYSL